MAKLLKRARYRGESEKHGSSEEIPVGGKVFIETLRRNIWKIRALPAHTSSDIFKKWDFFASVLISLPSTRKRRFRAPKTQAFENGSRSVFFLNRWLIVLCGLRIRCCHTPNRPYSVRDAITIPLDNCNAKPGNEIVVFENGEKIISFQKTAGTCRPGLTMVGEQPLVSAGVIIFTLYQNCLTNTCYVCEHTLFL